MSSFLETPLPSGQSAARAARLAKFEREQLIVDYLNRGVGVAEIAMRFDLSEKRMRALVREILARRAPAAPAEFAAIQVNRLHEALTIAYSAMSGGNLRAVDRVVKIVRELDRYQGLSGGAHGTEARRKLLESLNSGADRGPPGHRGRVPRARARALAEQGRSEALADILPDPAAFLAECRSQRR